METNSFVILPVEIKTLILEFLPLQDYSNIQLLCKEFHILLANSPSLWAKNILSYFLRPPLDEDDFFDDSFDCENPFQEESINFEGMRDSKNLTIGYFDLKGKWKNFLNNFLPEAQGQELTNHVFKIFKLANYPVPVLKKDIHHFPTNTMFKNFLTEVYFGLSNKSSLLDKKQSMISSIIKEIESSLNPENLSNVDRLISFRWYLFDSINVSDTEKSTQKADSLCELYHLLYFLIQSRCQMILSFLQAIKIPQQLLSEYVRLWNCFVKTLLELNRIFAPFSKFLNEIYNSNCQSYPNFPEFSLWRFMVKIWLNDVYSPLQESLHSAFRADLLALRTSESSFDFFHPLNLEPKSLDERDYKILSNFYASKPGSDNEDNKEARLRLLKEFYQRICDISYDEFTIFYWNCSPTNPETPKGKIDALIIQDSLQLYEFCKKFFFKQSKQIDSFLKADIELAEDLFCSELVLKVKQGQLDTIKDSLEEVFTSVIEELTCNMEKIKETLGKFPTNDYGVQLQNRVNFAGILYFLKTQEKLGQRIWSDQKFREGLCELITTKYGHFNAFLKFLTNLNEELESQRKECEEVSKELSEKGFVKMDEKFENFLTLNKNPSCLDLHIYNVQIK